MPPLRAMHTEAGGTGRVVVMPRHRDLSDATRIDLRFHDLRASCVTWMAVRGDTIGTGLRTLRRTAPAAAPGGLETPSIDPEKIRDSPSLRNFSGADGTRTRGLRRDRPAL
jgi:hypothetical protein